MYPPKDHFILLSSIVPSKLTRPNPAQPSPPSIMCIYAQYRCMDCMHIPAYGSRGGRAFCICPCQRYLGAADSDKDTIVSRRRVRDEAIPCEGEQVRFFYINEVCPRCLPDKARDAGWPLYTNSALPAARVLEWYIPFVQMRGEFREVSYTKPSVEHEDDESISPKSRPIPKSDQQPALSVRPEQSEAGDPQSRASTATDNSANSTNALRRSKSLQELPVDRAKRKGRPSSSPPAPTRNESKGKGPARPNLEPHPGDTFYDEF